MVTPQQQQQIEAVMEALSAYIANPPWEEWMVEVFTYAIDYAAEMLEISDEDVLDYLDEPPLGQMAHAHVFEHFVTTETNESDELLLDEFIRKQGQAGLEPFAQHYLQALAKAELAIWEIKSLKAGVSVEVKRLGTQEKTITVATEAKSIPKNMCIAARVLQLPNGFNTFGYSLLPIEREEADDILAYLQQVREEGALTPESVDKAHPQGMEANLAEDLADLLFHETLASWISQGFEE